MDDIDEGALLKAYSLDTLEPTVWSDVNHEATGDAQNQFLSTDEPDPLGLLRTVLPSGRSINKDILPMIHPSSKTFDPKVFLSNVHPDATFADLNSGNAYLKHQIEQRSEALKILVESNFDKFVAVKATTDAVHREMRDGREGPLRDENEFGVGQLKEILANASAKADQVFMPVLENNLKAIKVRSTLGVFERSRFFFNLPGSLGEAIEAGKYEQALRDYKRGKYLMDSKPGQLLSFGSTTNIAGKGGPEGDVNGAAATEDGESVGQKQQAQQRRVFAKVWEAVESTMQDLRSQLLRQLQEPKRGVEEQEKTIEILQELEIDQDPVAVFLEAQHSHIRTLMGKSFDSGNAKVEAAASVDGLVVYNEAERAKDLRSCVRQIALAEHSYDRLIGVQGWKAIVDLVRHLSETLVQTLPTFWRVLADGKLKSRSTSIQAHARAWASESVESYISTLSAFFNLTDVSLLAKQPLSPLPAWVPKCTSSLTAAHFLKAILNDLTESINDLRALKIGSTPEKLQDLLNNVSFSFVEVICHLWQEDAKIIHRLEDWTINPEEDATTLFLGEVAAFHSSNARAAYHLARGREVASGGHSHQHKDEAGSGNGVPSAECTARIKGTFIDTIYVYLDGIVHLAFSEYSPLDVRTTPSQKFIVDSSTKQPMVIDVKDLDTRILLAVTNLSHFTRKVVPNLAKHFHEAFHVRMGDDLRTIDEVAIELDKILFENFIERKSAIVGEIFQRGILQSGIDWEHVPKPREVHPFIYEALLALVQVHAQVRTVAKPLVARTISTLLEGIAEVVLNAFDQIKRFGMGGMLQSTLEIEFVHQTLALYVSPKAEQKLKQIYESISQKYEQQSSGGADAASLQSELENVKRILVASRKATALEFLCFRKPREPTAGTGATSSSTTTTADTPAERRTTSSSRSRTAAA